MGELPESIANGMRAGLLWLIMASSMACGMTFSPALLKAQSTGSIVVTITNIKRSQPGAIVVALYDRPSTWLSPDSATSRKRVPVDGDSVVVQFDALPYHDGYAIAVTHDRNGNNKMDMRWLPFPKPAEGAGVSGNHIRMAKPRYDEARFDLRAPVATQRIVMRY